MKYVGSKNRISKEIAPIIQSYIDNMPNCKGYIEPFVGGANMIDKIKCNNKIGLDIHKYLIALLEQASSDCSVFPTTITKEQYTEIKTALSSDDKWFFPEWYVGLVGFCASYNGKWFGGYANNVKTKIGTVRNYTDESINNLRKQAPNLKGIKFINKSFQELNSDKVKGYVIYCDPPYRATTKYATSEFPYEEFYDWCRKFSKENIVLISEYNMPDDFECIWSKSVTTSLDNNRVGKNNTRVEKLFKYKGTDGI